MPTVTWESKHDGQCIEVEVVISSNPGRGPTFRYRLFAKERRAGLNRRIVLRGVSKSNGDQVIRAVILQLTDRPICTVRLSEQVLEPIGIPSSFSLFADAGIKINYPVRQEDLQEIDALFEESEEEEPDGDCEDDDGEPEVAEVRGKAGGFAGA